LKMEDSGNLVLYKRGRSPRRLMETLVIGWSSNTSVTDGIPKMTLFSNGNASGLVIYEMESMNDTNPVPLWKQTVDTGSLVGNLTLSLSDDATLDLSDESGILWSTTSSFSTTVPISGDEEEDDQKPKITMYITIGVCSLACVLLVIIGAYFYSKRTKEELFRTTSVNMAHSNDTGPPTTLHPDTLQAVPSNSAPSMMSEGSTEDALRAASLRQASSYSLNLFNRLSLRSTKSFSTNSNPEPSPSGLGTATVSNEA